MDHHQHYPTSKNAPSANLPPPQSTLQHQTPTPAAAVNQHHQHHHHQLLHQQQQNHHHHHHSHHHQQLRAAAANAGDLPLRVVVNSGLIGAIIGRGGATIRQITNQTKARIDVNRDRDADQKTDKVITIHGSPVNCSAACFKILEIIFCETSNANNLNNCQPQQQQLATSNNDATVNNIDHEASNNNNDFINNNNNESNLENNNDNASNVTSTSYQQPVQLRILAMNNLIGRLIGRNGASIKKIMKQTNTRINVSASNFADWTNERIITMEGSLDDVRQAETMVSTKLRDAYVVDMSINMQNMNQQSYVYHNFTLPLVSAPYTQNAMISSQSGANHSIPRNNETNSGSTHHISHHRHSMTSAQPLYPSPSYLPYYNNVHLSGPPHNFLGPFGPNLTAINNEKETVHIFIPNSTVGAVIGKSGAAIKEMIISSGATIKVASAVPADLTQTTRTNEDSEQSARQNLDKDLSNNQLAEQDLIANNKQLLADEGDKNENSKEIEKSEINSSDKHNQSQIANVEGKSDLTNHDFNLGKINNGDEEEIKRNTKSNQENVSNTERSSEKTFPSQKKGQDEAKTEKNDEATAAIKTQEQEENEDNSKSDTNKVLQDAENSNQSQANQMRSEDRDDQDANHQNSNSTTNHQNDSDRNITRRVTIIGTPDSQYSAQYLIYRKVSLETGKHSVSLMVEIKVPSQLVGKIIGKGGSMVKLLQNQTKTSIRLPGEKPTRNSDVEISETSVQITGEFENSQFAQRQIRSLVQSGLSATIVR